MTYDKTPARILGEAAEILESYPEYDCTLIAEIFRKAEKEYQRREGIPKWDDPTPYKYGPIDLTGSGLFGKTYWELAYELAVNFLEESNV